MSDTEEVLRRIADELRTLNQTLRGWQEPLHVVIDTPQPPPITATKAVLPYSGDTLAGLTVDTTTGKGTANSADDKGDTDAPAPAGAVATFSIVPGPSGAVPVTAGTPD